MVGKGGTFLVKLLLAVVQNVTEVAAGSQSYFRKQSISSHSQPALEERKSLLVRRNAQSHTYLGIVCSHDLLINPTNVSTKLRKIMTF
jgi:hypothetical protein